MDDSYVNSFTSSSPITSQSMTKFGGNNENDEFGSHKSQKSDKMVMKHFMSPAIPAATKATLFPKRKILAERNEACTFTKPPILDSRTSPIVSAPSVRFSCSSDCESDDVGLNDFDVDSSMKKPYDPLTNYLSPRPKYLRYKPNRKHRIFLHGESDTEERKDGLDVVCVSSSSESQKEVVEEETYEEGSVKKEDDESEKTEGSRNGNDEEDVEEEEIEEFEEEEEEEEKKCWSLLGLLKFLFVLGSLLISTSFIYSMNSPDNSLIEESNRDFIDGVVNQGNVHEVDRRKEFFASETEALVGKGEESHISLLNVTQKYMDSELWSSEVDEDDKGLLASTVELEEVDVVQNEKSEDVYNDGLTSKVGASDALQWEEAKESEANINVEVARYIEAEASSGSYFRANVQEDLDQLKGKDAVEFTESFRDDMSTEIEANAYLNAENEQMESTEEIKLQLEVVVALAVLLTIVAALGLLYYVKQRNSSEDSLHTQEVSGEEDSFGIEAHQPNAEPVETSQRRNNNVSPSLEDELVQKVESFASPSTPVPSMNSEDISRQSQAPIVELLGELVIAENTSSSFRRSRRTRILESEEKNASNSLSTQMMISRSKTSLIPSQLHSSQLVHSTADSSSRKKNSAVKKEEGRSREVSTPTITPVRRSSRIRNKAMSP